MCVIHKLNVLMNRFTKRTVILPLILFVYTTVMAIFFIPQNHEMGTAEKWVTVSGSYLIIIALYFVLRMREKRRMEREDELKGKK